MDYYGKHPQEQAVQELLHNINQRTASLRRLEREQRAIDTEVSQRVANDVLAACKLIDRTIDEYLTKWKQFPTPQA